MTVAAATIENPRPLTSNIPLMLTNFEAVRELCTIVEHFANYANRYHQTPQIPTIIHVSPPHLKRFTELIYTNRHAVRQMQLKIELNIKYEGDPCDSVTLTRGYCQIQFIKHTPTAAP